MKCTFEKVPFALKEPFVITGRTFNVTDTLHVTLERDGYRGRGEGVGVYYLDDTIDTMLDQLERIAPEIEAGLTHRDLRETLPPGGALNALDCAFWDLAVKQEGSTIWQKLGMEPRSLKTVCTIGIGSVEAMAQKAVEYANYPNLKIKLDADQPIAKLEAIRANRPDASLIIDVNQGWSFDELKDYTPHCARLDIEMIEQPLKRGADDCLEGYKSPVLLGADESCLHAGEYEMAKNRYDVINIKLDKCGGLSGALEIIKLAQGDGKKLMVGNMTGTSLSMAPSYVVGQFCDFIDIDGPLLLADDVKGGMFYSQCGQVEMPNSALWG